MYSLAVAVVRELRSYFVYYEYSIAMPEYKTTPDLHPVPVNSHLATLVG